MISREEEIYLLTVRTERYKDYLEELITFIDTNPTGDWSQYALMRVEQIRNRVFNDHSFNVK